MGKLLIKNLKMVHKHKVNLEISGKEYYDHEESLGRVRINRRIFENEGCKVIDFERYILPHTFGKYGYSKYQKVYSHYLLNGYFF